VLLCRLEWDDDQGEVCILKHVIKDLNSLPVGMSNYVPQ
jgi:hypothetical protein